uniref:Prqfvamide 1 n=1 Tax=Deroceras reticulatum TaxID=145610 RepID=A0A1X9WED6_DERRE|nr:prqfvamide 1 [Deroceras reticulatum]
MLLISVTLLCLLALSQALTTGLSETHGKVLESQPNQIPSRNVVIAHPKPGQHTFSEHQQHKQASRHDSGYSNVRSKRDSVQLEDGLDLDKRVRDFVGKRSPPEMYSTIPEPLLITPVDISDDVGYPIEVALAPADSSIFGYDVDETENISGDAEEKAWNPFDKRLREFVGKRGESDYLGEISKRVRDFVGKRESLDNYESGMLEKRPREFVGKRADIEDNDDFTLLNNESHFPDPSYRFRDVDKRPREFLGKRDETDESNDIDKRLRDFVGKRADTFLDDPSVDLEKRVREFVGKRQDKRPRQFVGKRPRQFVGKRPRQFVGKRPRQFVGKRPRQFVGKRPRQFVGKRPRQFVGKREDLRPRQFVGKLEEKRPRQFVGKRSTLFDDYEDDNIELAKKLRDFVGKRSSEDELYEEDKRLRDFVGKRSQVGLSLDELSAIKRLRDFVGKETTYLISIQDTLSRELGNLSVEDESLLIMEAAF